MEAGRRVPLLILAAAGISGAVAAPEKHLLLDRTVIASSHNLATVLGRVEKSPRNPLFGEEYPWEPRLDNVYPNVVWDPERRLYRCWYTPFIVWRVDPRTSTPQRIRWSYLEPGVCYAESADGLSWRKPLRAEFPFGGRPSNVVFRHAGDAGVLWDRREADPARRFKMLYRPEAGGKLGPLAAAFSADGLHWSAGASLGLPVQSDTHNNAIWAPTLGRYVALTRDWKAAPGEKGKGVRWVSRTESADFAHWSPARQIFGGRDESDQVYSMPIFFYGGVYLGLPTLYNACTDRTQVELAWSKDTIHWERIEPGHPLIPHAEVRGAYDWGCVYASVPVFEPDRIAIYYGASDDIHTGVRRSFLALATLAPDGFAGVTPAGADGAGELVTAPVEAADEVLTLSAEIAPGGSIHVDVLGGTDDRVLGLLNLNAQAQAWSLRGTMMPVPGDQVSPGTRVRLRFKLSHATLYSFSI